MSKRAIRNQEFDLFIPRLSSLPLKDQREVMERPQSSRWTAVERPARLLSRKRLEQAEHQIRKWRRQ